MKITKGNDMMAGGEFVTVELSNGNVVIVWDKSVDDDRLGLVERYESIDALQRGRCPLQQWKIG